MKHEEPKGTGNGPVNEGNDCGCGDGCYPPKKKNPLKIMLFLAIVLAAAAILAFKLTCDPAPAAAKEPCCPENSSACCDTAKTAPADSLKKSPCCAE